MHRVEIIVRHDREAAKRVGAEDIILDLDAGKARSISMGCKVPFDVCTCCGHISRTTADYCPCLKTQMGSVRPDGKIVGAANLFPRFFDLSDVFVPAAKESGTLMKVAQVYSRQSLDKRAKAKSATIKKEVIPNAGHRALHNCFRSELDLPKEILGGPDFAKLLTTMAMLGIVAKPQEFQYGMLRRMGEKPLAESLKQRGITFAPRPADTPSRFLPDSHSPSLARMLSGVLPERSGFYPHLPRRIIRISVTRVRSPAEKVAHVSDSILDKVAAAYASYRLAFRELPSALNLVIDRDLDYYKQNFFGDVVTDHFEKNATSSFAAALSEPLVPLYLYNAYRDTISAAPDSWGMKTSAASPAKSLLHPVL
jgi:hypothetical protein